MVGVEERLKRIINADGIPEFFIVDKHGKILRKYALDNAGVNSEGSSTTIVKELTVQAQEFVEKQDLKTEFQELKKTLDRNGLYSHACYSNAL